MDYKDKYEALVGGIKGWLDKYVGDWRRGVFNLPFDKTGEIAKDIIKLVPELRESEDEKNWKAVLGYVKDDALRVWLEKQKEASKAIEAVDRIDKYIDVHLANAHDMKDSNPDKKYYLGLDDALGKIAGILQDVYSEKQKEQNPIEIAPNQFDGITYEMQGHSTAKPAEWSEEDEKNLVSVLWHVSNSITNRERSDCHCDLTDWLKNLRERLKSLRPQPQWKPSEEQMDAVNRVKKAIGPGPLYDQLGSLLNDLKKL